MKQLDFKPEVKRISMDKQGGESKEEEVIMNR